MHPEDDVPALGIQAIVDALAWAKTTGWSNDHTDIVQAARLWRRLTAIPMDREARGRRFMDALVRLYDRSGSDPRHRAVLARTSCAPRAVTGDSGSASRAPGTSGFRFPPSPRGIDRLLELGHEDC